MATEQDYMVALDKADQDGDTEAVGYFTSKIKELRTSQPATVATAAQQPDQPYYRAPDFAGQPYFDDEYAVIKREEHELMGNWKAPDFAQRYQAIKQREKQLFDDRSKWNKGFPDELKKLPELTAQTRQGGERATGALIAGLLAPEQDDRMAILENFGWKVETVNGFPKFTDTESGEEYALNKPGLSQRDLIDFMVTALQFFPAAKVTSLIKGLGFKPMAKKVTTGMATASLTELSKQGIEKALGGEIDGEPIALAALFGGATEVALPILRGIWSKLGREGREKMLNAKSLEEIQSLGVASRKEMDELGNLIGPDEISKAPPLNRPQTTGSATDKGKLMAAANDPKLAEKMAEANSARDVWAKGRLDKAVEGEPLENALMDAREASEEIFEQMYNRRKAEANKLYGNAFKGAKDVDVSGLRGHIKTIIDDKSIVGGEKARILGFVQKYLETAKGDMLPAKLAQELKFEIDSLIGKRGMTAVGQNTEAALIDVQSQLKNLIEEAAPGYKRANAAFRARTEGIDAMQEDLIGLISKKTDSNIETIGRLLDTKDVPRLLAVKGLTDQVDPRIWANMHRNWLKSKVGNLPSNLMDKPNPAKVMYDKVFGTEDLARRMIELAPDRNAKANLSWLKGYLLKSQRARGFDPAKSEKAFTQEQAKGGFRATTSKLLHSTRKSVASGILGNGERKRLDAIFDAMEGPEWAKRMEIVRQKGLTEEAADEFNKILNDVIRASAQGSRSEEELEVSPIMEKTFNIK
jgi:hypothetical protein